MFPTVDQFQLIPFSNSSSIPKDYTDPHDGFRIHNGIWKLWKTMEDFSGNSLLSRRPDTLSCPLSSL